MNARQQALQEALEAAQRHLDGIKNAEAYLEGEIKKHIAHASMQPGPNRVTGEKFTKVAALECELRHQPVIEKLLQERIAQIRKELSNESDD